TWDWNVAAVGLPYAIGATTVIFGKHIDKLPDDRAKGIHTLPVIIGEPAARWTVIAMFVLQYAIVAYFVLTGFFTPALLVIALAILSCQPCLFESNATQMRPIANGIAATMRPT